MNNRQQKAIGNPCVRAMDTVNREFWDYVFLYGRTLSSILTVNK
jgi:hypothetical protein